jgi:HEPN domain-containing protein
MKYPKEDARRWLKEAEATLLQAEEAVRDKFYNLACFLAEQAAQKALKAVLYLWGARQITIHSITELTQALVAKDSKFERFVPFGKQLDKYYILTRYPDAVPRPTIPSEIYTEEEASGAIKIAKEIFVACRMLIGSDSPQS